jgi:hypothetical protein
VTASAADITKTASVTVAPLAMTKLSASASLTGGNKGTGRVTFNGKTSGDGATVALTSAMPELLQVPPTVAAGANLTSVAFPITTSSTTTQRSVAVTATYQGVSKTFAVAVKPATLSSLSVSPTTIVGSQPGVVKVNLTGPAPATGLTVTLMSGDERVSIPASVTFEPGVVTKSVPVETELLTSSQQVTISATGNGTTKTAKVTVVPISVSSIILSSSPVGGNQTTITFTLNAPAPDGGVTLHLQSSSPTTVSLPATIAIPGEQRNVTVDYTPAVVSVDTPVTVSATYGSATKTVTVTVKPAGFLNLNLNSSAPNGGRFVEAVFSLSGPAPEAGVLVAVSGATVSPAGAAYPVELPASVFVPAGERSLRVTLPLDPVAVTTTASITATSGGRSVTARLTLYPPVFQDFTPRPLAVRPGEATKIVVKLSGRAPAGGVVVTMTSAQPSIASIPASVTIPAGEQSVTVDVTGGANAATGAASTIRITALGKSIQSAAVVSRLLLTDLTLSTETVMGGNILTGTVTLNGPAPTGGIAVGLDVVDEALSVPGSVLVPAGRTTASFTVTTYLVPSPRAAVVYARLASSVRTADVTVNALAPVSLTIDDDELEGGESLNATVTLNDTTPASSSVTVSIYPFSSDDDAVDFPTSVAFPRSSTTATFQVTAVPVAVDTLVTLVVEVNGQTTTPSG